MSVLHVNKLSAAYGKKEVLRDVAFACEAGEIVGLLGANGCGKTTLLKAVCGILPHAGTCAVDGAPLEGRSARQIARACAYVPQRSGMEANVTVLDAVMMAFNPKLPLLASPTSQMRMEAMQALEAVGLAGCAEDMFLSLSEGQKQLCLLARAFAGDARILILDEPESALDFGVRDRLNVLLRRWTQRGDAVLMALHDPALALNGCDRLLLMQGGRIARAVSPRKDALPILEEALSGIYGPVTVAACQDKTGAAHLVMLKEREQ